jgi:toxin-antitoxin system PIN domain toxin
VIVPDINLLVYAYNEAAPLHAAARRWWEALLSDEGPVGLPWASMLGFVRLVTHPRVLESPVAAEVAVDCVERWLAVPSVRIVDPGPRHLVIVRDLVRATGVAASLTTDTHLAAIAIEYQCELCSTDVDFARFPGLRWTNPLTNA